MKTDNKIKNVTSKVLSNIWAKLEQVSFDFTFKNGKTTRLTHEVYGKADGVAVLLYNPTTKNVVLSKQFRIPMYVAGVKNGFSIEVVGGSIDKNESPETSVIRETKEEIGYNISEIEKVSTVFLSPGLMREQVHLYIAKYTNEDKVENGGGLAEESEEITVLETSFQTALKMIENQEIIDARTIMLLYHLKVKGLI
ncbi:NUDIX domain-containing protein [Polaribacter batillariae]|uniref:GDP-mannose pyrophosphatase n=1 Tax=Polaribacter batillariae TaxID=2808900 RepID=A0ABX7SV96_9FLAO|nr:NUDIX domain-containing protein [Polaribacter batillariae]QTD38167.1 NUDIX domain-containing protein [Polaribacter batillariae]